ncbi:MAG: hypothetical protein C4314_04635, partial [Thermoflexus sp.]
QVAPIYTAPDPRIARKQVEALRRTVEAIGRIRQEALPLEERVRRLEAMSELRALSPEQRQRLLTLGAERWGRVASEALGLLDQVMREPIREEDRPGVIRQLPHRVSARLTEEEAELVAALVAPLILPNSFLDLEATEAAR